MKVFAQLIDALLLSRFEREKQKVWADFIENNSENESYIGLVTSLLKNECPKRIISAKNLKILAMETVGVKWSGKTGLEKSQIKPEITHPYETRTEKVHQ